MKSGSSPTWEARFAANLRGQAIAVPYPAADVTDEAKRSAATRSYQDVVRGASARASLIDIREVFSDDAKAKLSFVPQSGADGKTVLLQMCARCHDGRGNPQLGKNHFNVMALDTLPRVEKDLAITRLGATWKALQSSGDSRPFMSHGADSCASRNTPPDSRITRNTSENASIFFFWSLEQEVWRPGHSSPTPAAGESPVFAAPLAAVECISLAAAHALTRAAAAWSR